MGSIALTKVKLDINQITPGMKLAEPITNASGVTLMPAGLRLTPMFIVRLKKWNLESLEVFVESAPRPAGDGQTRVRNATSVAIGSGSLTAEQEEFARGVAIEVYKWFANVKDSPLMMQLRSVVTKRLVAHGPEGMINTMRRRGVANDAQAGAGEGS